MTRGLWWLIPRERLPWNKDTLPIWSNHSQFEGSADHLEKNARDYISKEERRLFSYVHSSEYRFSSTPPLVRQSHDDAVERIRFAKYGNVHQSDLVQKDIRSKLGVLSGQQNSDIASVASVPPLSSEEYFIYFLVRIWLYLPFYFHLYIHLNCSIYILNTERRTFICCKCCKKAGELWRVGCTNIYIYISVCIINTI